MRTAVDLVDLCDTGPASEHYIAAIHFCQGFGIGAYQYYAAQVTEDPSTRFVCIAHASPTRNGHGGVRQLGQGSSRVYERRGGAISVNIPANSVLVLQRQ